MPRGHASAPSLPIKTAYGFGSVATGITETGFNYFLLIFYSQVMGVDSRLVSLAVTIALLFDAFSDPIVGYWSDNLRSRWGRRHPFMYGAALPVALSYLLLWNPPTGFRRGDIREEKRAGAGPARRILCADHVRFSRRRPARRGFPGHTVAARCLLCADYFGALALHDCSHFHLSDWPKRS